MSQSILVKRFKKIVASTLISSLLLNPIAYAASSFIELDFKDSEVSHRLHTVMPLSSIEDISYLKLDLDEQKVTVHKETTTVDINLEADTVSAIPLESALNLSKENIRNLPWHLGGQGLKCFLSQHTAWLRPLGCGEYKLEFKGRLLGGGSDNEGDSGDGGYTSGGDSGGDYGGDNDDYGSSGGDYGGGNAITTTSGASVTTSSGASVGYSNDYGGGSYSSGSSDDRVQCPSNFNIDSDGCARGSDGRTIPVFDITQGTIVENSNAGSSDTRDTDFGRSYGKNSDGGSSNNNSNDNNNNSTTTTDSGSNPSTVQPAAPTPTPAQPNPAISQIFKNLKLAGLKPAAPTPQPAQPNPAISQIFKNLKLAGLKPAAPTPTPAQPQANPEPAQSEQPVAPVPEPQPVALVSEPAAEPAAPTQPEQPAAPTEQPVTPTPEPVAEPQVSQPVTEQPAPAPEVVPTPQPTESAPAEPAGEPQAPQPVTEQPANPEPVPTNPVSTPAVEQAPANPEPTQPVAEQPATESQAPQPTAESVPTPQPVEPAAEQTAPASEPAATEQPAAPAPTPVTDQAANSTSEPVAEQPITTTQPVVESQTPAAEPVSIPQPETTGVPASEPQSTETSQLPATPTPTPVAEQPVNPAPEASAASAPTPAAAETPEPVVEQAPVNPEPTQPEQAAAPEPAPTPAPVPAAEQVAAPVPTPVVEQPATLTSVAESQTPAAAAEQGAPSAPQQEKITEVVNVLEGMNQEGIISQDLSTVPAFLSSYTPDQLEALLHQLKIFIDLSKDESSLNQVIQTWEAEDEARGEFVSPEDAELIQVKMGGRLGLVLEFLKQGTQKAKDIFQKTADVYKRETTKRFIQKDWQKDLDIPQGWNKINPKKQDGVKYRLPGEKPADHHEIRIMKGRPESDYPGQRVDYVKLNKKGQFFDINGNVVPGDSFEAHIPLKGNEKVIENLIQQIWK